MHYYICDADAMRIHVVLLYFKLLLKYHPLLDGDVLYNFVKNDYIYYEIDYSILVKMAVDTIQLR